MSFRWSTRERAVELGVAGWVRNEPDGSVLIEAQGSARSVDALIEWARTGPPGARVESIDVAEIGLGDGEAAFEIRR